MSTQRPRARFVPTLTEVIRPTQAAAVNVSKADEVPIEEVGTPPERMGTPPSTPQESPASRSSMLEAAVEGLLPEAREQLRQKLHAAAYALAEEQLHAMEDALRQQLRAAVRKAAGMGARR